MDFRGKSRAPKKGKNFPLTRYENQLARTLDTFTSMLVRNHVGSMLIHVLSYPAKLAGILSQEQEEKCMYEFKLDLESYWAAEEIACVIAR